jgi:hypothetical protein
MTLKDVVTLKPIEGYRTYIVIAIIFIVGGLNALGYVDANLYDIILKMLIPVGAATFVAHEQKEEVVQP